MSSAETKSHQRVLGSDIYIYLRGDLAGWASRLVSELSPGSAGTAQLQSFTLPGVGRMS